MSFIGDYFLMRHVKEQQEKFDAELRVSKPYNQEKFESLEQALEEVKYKLANASKAENKNNQQSMEIKKLQEKIAYLERINSAKDNHINVLSKELDKEKEKNKELSPSTKNYIDFLHEQAHKNNLVKTKDKSMDQGKSMSLAK